MIDWLRNLLIVPEAVAPQPATEIAAAPQVSNVIEYEPADSSDRLAMAARFQLDMSAPGVKVTASTAMRTTAVYSCVRLIAGAVSMLAAKVYERTPEGRREADDHEFWWLLNESPTARFTSADMWEYLVASMLLRADGIAYIDRVMPSGKIRGFIPVNRDNVHIFRQGDRLRYTIFDYDSFGQIRNFTVDQSDVLHFAGFGFDGICGRTAIQWGARSAIGVALEADQFSGDVFRKGGHIQHAVLSQKTMTKEMQDEFREAWVATYSGRGVTGVPLVLTNGLDVKELSMTAADAQLLETRKFSVVDIARCFGIPPHMIGEASVSTWGTGIEQIGIGFVTYTLMPTLTKMRQEITRKLWPIRTKYYVEFDVSTLLEGDSKTQAEVFAKALGGPGTQGYMAVNEVRRKKHLPPLPGGDTINSGSPPKPEKQKADDDEK